MVMHECGAELTLVSLFDGPVFAWVARRLAAEHGRSS